MSLPLWYGVTLFNLLLLNWADWYFTRWGLALETIVEANPLMVNWIVQYPWAVLLLKLVFSLILSGLCLVAYVRSGRTWTLWAPWGMIGGLMGIMAIHGFWIWQLNL